MMLILLMLGWNPEQEMEQVTNLYNNFIDEFTRTLESDGRRTTHKAAATLAKNFIDGGYKKIEGFSIVHKAKDVILFLMFIEAKILGSKQKNIQDGKKELISIAEIALHFGMKLLATRLYQRVAEISFGILDGDS